jgi:hypothetical protein
LPTIAAYLPCFAAAESQPLFLQNAPTRSWHCCPHCHAAFHPTALLPPSVQFPQQSLARLISVTQRQPLGQHIRRVRSAWTTRLPSLRCSSRATRPSGNTEAVPSSIHAPRSLSVSESLPWQATRFGAAPLPTFPSSPIPTSAATSLAAAWLHISPDVPSPRGFFRSIARSNRIELLFESPSCSGFIPMRHQWLSDLTATANHALQ